MGYPFIPGDDSAYNLQKGVDLKEETTLVTPASGRRKMYAKSDGFYEKDSTGTERKFSGDVTGQASSVDSEIALFSGTGGKTIKRATGTGYVKVLSGVLQTPSATIPGADVVTATSTAAGAVPKYSEGSFTYTATSSTAGTVTSANITNRNMQYVQVGNRVYVTGMASLNAASAGFARFRMTLPIASNIGANSDLMGTVTLRQNDTSTGNSFAGFVVGDVGNDAAEVNIEIANLSTNVAYFSFMYVII
jgi:hypothetical protein